MDLICDERPSDSPLVETIWRSQSDQANPFISIADGRFSMVITKYREKLTFTVRGPETKATPAIGLTCAEYFGIRFRPGVFMPALPPKMLMDRNDQNPPEAGRNAFWLDGSVWQIPNYENVDIFVDWLAREGLLVYDPLVKTVLNGEPTDLSIRSVQRRFLQATGITQNSFHQIERARYATMLLKQGFSIQDAIYYAGYFDQSHMTRSMKYFIGLTPSQILDQGREAPLSFLYKTIPFAKVKINQKEDNYEKISHI
ncbi:MAG: AraC family transcriptional regulator [Chloroflexi bacterium HGW-Chloroflexi-10]|nr:MAG: AraC family transcriptional regulator [Chloroflexi bacterium HGW-Chloroflexi-10]